MGSRPPRSGVRRVQAPRVVPEYVTEAAEVFASHVSMPEGAGKNAPMRDLKGWLASLVSIDVLPHWVRAAGALSFNISNAQDLRYRAEVFTRTVLRSVLDRDRSRSQSIDTTLRRQCCTDPHKSGLTFMKILIAICAAYDFAGSTSRCYHGPYLGVTSSTASLWLMRYEYLVQSLNAVRMCVRNDHASKLLVAHITDNGWGRKLATLLLEDHHSVCWSEPAIYFSKPCASRDGGVEQRALCFAICKAVIDAAPYIPSRPRVMRGFFTHTQENDPLCCAALLMPHNPKLAISLVDHAIGLDPARIIGRSGIPVEIHREMRIYDAVKRVARNAENVVTIMTSFSRVFKFNKPPLRWWPEEHEVDLITSAAANQNAVAMTVWALMVEHMVETGRSSTSESDKVRALQMYQKSFDYGDLFGIMHAAKIYLEGGNGVERDPKKAEACLWEAAKNNVRVAISVLGDLYAGGGEPQVKKNVTLAARLYQAASDAGCFRAAKGLAALYEEGLGGLPQDPTMAEKLRKFASEKEEKKRLQYAQLKAVDANTPIPNPDNLLRMTSQGSLTFDTLAISPPENPSAYIPTPTIGEETPGSRRHRDADIEPNEFEFPVSSSTTSDVPIPVDIPSSWDCTVKRRRTGISEVLEIWR